MSSPSQFDDWLAAELRNTQLPDGLLVRLRAIAAVSDNELDGALRSVPLPRGFLQRLERIGQSRRENWSDWRQAGLKQWAVAASLFLALGLTWLAGLASVLGNGSRWQPDPPGNWVASVSTDMGLGTDDDPNTIPIEIPLASFEPAWELPVESLAQVAGSMSLMFSMPRYGDPDKGRAPWTPGSDRLGPVVDALAGLYPDVQASPDRLADLLMTDMSLVGLEGVLADARFDLPELKKVPPRIPRGVEPLGEGVRNRIARLTTGIFPFSNPVEQPKCLVPLAVDASSFEYLRLLLEGDQLPAKDKVRTEEFLAALDYGFVKPTGQALAMRVAGGPSPLSFPGVGLLQIGVQARDLPSTRRGPTHLTLAIDVSDSMGRWLPMMKKALTSLVSQLSPGDRVSLIAFNEEAELLVEDVSREDPSPLLAAIATLQTGRATNLGRGLALAVATAQPSSHSTVAPARKTSHRMVLLTDGLAELEPAVMALVESRLKAVAATGVALDVIELRGVDLSGEQVPDRMLSDLAVIGHGTVRRAINANQIRWSLLESLSGRSQIVARDARLSITFNSKVVGSYRLLGHEPTPVADLLPPRLEVDLSAGESAVALFEVFLKPGKDAEVGIAVLEWFDPRDGTPRRAEQPIRRSSFTPTAAEATPAWQLSAVAAAAAELLRDSPFAQDRTLADVVQMCNQLNSSVRERPSVQEFVSVLRSAEKLAPKLPRRPRPR